ncbi:MAG: hypothetical protein MUQ56_09895, partial [Thermoleophilia bacterium]|nr:hypothetical protein [Thermoleophilia bacterium]
FECDGPEAVVDDRTVEVDDDDADRSGPGIAHHRFDGDGRLFERQGGGDVPGALGAPSELLPEPETCRGAAVAAVAVSHRAELRKRHVHLLFAHSGNCSAKHSGQSE